eukprot:m.63603 g.63603  ORF g.63603 m.63603 type:complete len:185 (-) comp8163_c0_seq2:213-767(-)
MVKGSNKAVDARGARTGNSGVAKQFKKAQAAKAATKVLHPNSRKAARLQRSVLRDDKLAKMKKQANKRHLKEGERLLWFQDALTPGKEVYTFEEICELIEAYIHRHDEEIEAIRSEAALRGRPVQGNREHVLSMLQKVETEEFRTGFKLPDLRIPKMVKLFTEWQLELNLIPRFQMALFKPVDA